MTFTLIDILTLAFGAGAVTSIIGWIKDWIIDQRKNKQSSDYAALRLAVILEEFSIKCAMLISDYEMYISSGGQGGSANLAMPSLSAYPIDIDWRNITSYQSSRILGLPNEILKAKALIEEYWHIEPQLMAETTSEYSGYCGHLAWIMSKDLRSNYKLPAYEMSLALWDESKDLKKYYDLVVERKFKAKKGG